MFHKMMNLHPIVFGCDFFHAEKERTPCKDEQIHKMTTIFTQNGPRVSFEHGGSDSTVIKRRQQQLGRMADFLPSVTLSVFDL